MKKKLVAIMVAVVIGLVGVMLIRNRSADNQTQESVKKVRDAKGIIPKNPNRNWDYWEGDMPQLAFRGKGGNGENLEIHHFYNEDSHCRDLSFKLMVNGKEYPFRGQISGNKLESPGFSLTFGYADNEEAYPRRAAGYFVIDGKKLSVQMAGLGSSANDDHWSEALKKVKLD